MTGEHLNLDKIVWLFSVDIDKRLSTCIPILKESKLDILLSHVNCMKCYICVELLIMMSYDFMI